MLQFFTCQSLGWVDSELCPRSSGPVITHWRTDGWEEIFHIIGKKAFKKHLFSSSWGQQSKFVWSWKRSRWAGRRQQVPAPGPPPLPPKELWVQCPDQLKLLPVSKVSILLFLWPLSMVLFLCPMALNKTSSFPLLFPLHSVLPILYFKF